MPKSEAFADQTLGLALNGTAYGWAGAGELWAALHTSQPGENQTDSEADYTGYVRVSVVRDGSGWSVSGGVASNLVRLAFPQNNGTAQALTHLSIGLASAGSSQVLYVGAMTDALMINALDAPVFEAGSLQIEEL
jgi:hypothetical protein